MFDDSSPLLRGRLGGGCFRIREKSNPPLTPSLIREKSLCNHLLHGISKGPGGLHFAIRGNLVPADLQTIVGPIAGPP